MKIFWVSAFDSNNFCVRGITILNMTQTVRTTPHAAGVKAGLFTVPLLINGAEHITAQSFPIRSPGSGDIIHECSSVSEVEAKAAVSAAAAALESWRNVVPAARRDILLKTADNLDKKRVDLVKIMCEETGSAEAWAQFNVANTIDLIKDVAGRVSSIVGQSPTTTDPNFDAVVISEPYGVVLAIAPW